MTLDELKKFCNPLHGRPFVQAPFNQDVWTYVTDGVIVIRTALIDGLPSVSTSEIDIAGFFSKHYRPREWQPVPACSAPQKVKCPSCGGDGIVECNFGHEHECPDCDGFVRMKQFRPVPVIVGDAEYDAHYLHMLQGWDISPRGLESAALRRGDDIGMLMPLTPRTGGKKP